MKKSKVKEKAKPTRGKGLEWEKLRNYECMEAFEESEVFKDLKSNFNKHRSNNTKKNGTVKEYQCKYSKYKKGFNCQAKMKTVFRNGIVELFTNKTKHEHKKVDNRENVYYTKEQEEKIKTLINLDVSRKNIRKDLEEQKMFEADDFPGIESINNKIKNLTKEMKRTQRPITVDELKEVVEANTDTPEDENEAFIVNSKLLEDENGGLIKFVIIMSTKNLIMKNLELSTDRWMLALDSTYQTNMDECPVIMFGKIGADGKFRPIGLVLTKKEDMDSYKLVLDFIRETSKVNPESVMADGDPAITAAAEEVFPNAVRLMCFTHVMRNVNEKLARIRALDPAISQNISNDIRALQHGALDEESFHVLYGLMQRKWTEDLKERIREFFLYFGNTWCRSATCKWYQACNPQHATTNNSVEGTNNSFKRDFTLNKKLSIPHLVSKFAEQLKIWSGQEIKVKSRPETARLTVKQKAISLHEEHTGDRDFILSRKVKASDRFIIKKDFGIVRGKPVEVTIVPKDIKTEDMVKDDFAKIGKEIMKRRRSISFENFDQFKDDLRVVAVFEAVISGNGETDYVCNCSYPNLPSGVKRKRKVIVEKKGISDGTKSKGRPPNMRKQPSYSTFSYLEIYVEFNKHFIAFYV